MDSFEQFLRNYNPLAKELSINDVIFFLNDYSQIKFHWPTKVLLLSEMFFHPHNVVIPFGHWNEMNNEVRIQKMHNIFKLCKFWLLEAQLKEFRLPTELTKLIDERYRVRSWESYVHAMSDERPNGFFGRILERLFGPKIYTPKLWNYHFMEFISDHYDLLMSNLVLWANFDLKIYDTFRFFDGVMKVVVKLTPANEKKKQWLRLYEEISQRTWWAVNYGWKIELAYPLRKYAEECWFYDDILYSLHVPQKLNISKRWIEGQYVNFVIEKIVDLDKKDFIFDFEGEQSEAVGKSGYDQVNRILTVWWKSFEFTKNSKSADILKLAYSVRDKTGRAFIGMGELGDEYESRRNEFKNISQKDLNYDSLNWMLKQRLTKIRMELWTKKKIIGLSTSWLELDC